MSPSLYRPSLLLLISFVAVSQIGAVIHTPSLPAMGRAFAANELAVQLTMTSYLIGFAVTQVFVGTLSDAVGRRPVVVAGMVVFVIASFGCAFAPTIEVMIALRPIQAAGACAGLVVTRAIIRDSFDPSQTTRYMGYLGMAIGFMPAFSPSFGGVLQSSFGWYANFIAMAIVGVIAVVAGLAGLQETLPAERRRSGGLKALLKGYPELLSSPSFLAYTSAITMSTAVFFVYLTAGPQILQGGYGINPAVYGFVAMTMPIGYITGNYVSSSVSSDIGIARGAYLGYVIMLLGCALLLTIPDLFPFSLPVYIGPMLVIGFGAGFVTSCGYAGIVMGDPALAGTASGLSGMLQMACTALVTVAVGVLEINTLFIYGVMQLVLTAGGLLILFLLLWLARMVEPVRA